MADDFDENGNPQSTLGERLLSGVQNLWQRVSRLDKVAAHHGVEIEALKSEFRELKAQVHGLRVSRGKAVAAKQKLETKLNEISDRLN